MDHARDRDGERRWSREFTYEQAGQLEFQCAYCPAPVFARMMPNWRPPPGSARARRFWDPPEICFAAHPSKPHADDCDPAGDPVAALIAERTVSSRSGPPGAPPGRILLRAERVTKAGIAGDGGSDGGPVRSRTVDDGAEHRQQGPRETTLSHIRQACEAYASGADILDRPLVVPGLLPSEADTYGRVFRPLLDDHPCETAAIWHWTLRFRAPVRFDRPVLFLPGIEASVSIDRSGWPTMQRERLDAELEIILKRANTLWDEHPRIACAPTLFALATRRPGALRLVVADSRLATVLLLDRPIRRPASS
jgi:hypothetical protein